LRVGGVQFGSIGVGLAGAGAGDAGVSGIVVVKNWQLGSKIKIASVPIMKDRPNPLNRRVCLPPTVVAFEFVFIFLSPENA
jgi:hypothetical protein